VLHEEVVDDVVAEVAMVETNDDESVGRNIEFERMECRDIQISRIAAESLAGPPEACRPQEGLKT
jgi:hypothetical protein